MGDWAVAGGTDRKVVAAIVVAGTTVFIPTNAIDLIPGGKPVRRGAIAGELVYRPTSKLVSRVSARAEVVDAARVRVANSAIAVEQVGLTKLALPRTPGLGATSTTSELLQSGAIPDREGVVLTQRTVSFNDIWKFSDNSGVEFMLTRENRNFVLRSGLPTSVSVLGGVRPIVHTHPVDADGLNSLLPSRADINVLNDYWARNPTLSRPVSQIITGPDQTTIFRATGIDQWRKPK
ncbi:hypothetical protein N8I74_14515 [Chitiniphilus purpureus]|uniref:Uncharacterized protein n=1 Tax=Chitiniphilus purpureus TaxID=2981137 RepID=A0ABY6DKG0_9NEIS|nr:hypothetical protein [Chitiniphilus sp. CD1]UXY14522.1 hypothetical protein N8I74_14515 [Chitiniphilus sp. CD1]